MARVTPSDPPRFVQSPDLDRPMTMLTVDPRRAGQLVYRYLDSGETVVVPNIPCNQPAGLRAATLAWRLQQMKSELQRRLADSPYLSGFERRLIRHEHRTRAKRLVEHARALGSLPDQGAPTRL